MSEQQPQKRKISNLFYGVIGIATLMIATIGATFAYFTATASNNTVILGNMASIRFDLNVVKVTDVEESRGGMIPMSNNMVEQALTSSEICVDNNGNAVCQVYKITVTNDSTASMFLDGYVTLTGGSGAPDDIGPNGKNLYTEANLTGKTTMRWAQAFCSTETDNKVTTCSTGNKISNTVYSTLRTDTGETPIELTALGGESTKETGFNPTEILTTKNEIVGSTKINGNSYEIINKNYIRISTPHVFGNTSYKRADDTTSALVYNQYLAANDYSDSNNTGTSISNHYTDAQVYYIVVWLSENGHNQTAGSTGTGVNAINFFQGNVTFVSAQGSEVTATFSNYVRITPNT